MFHTHLKEIFTMLNDAIRGGTVASGERGMEVHAADRKALRLSATLLFIGALLSVVAGIFHPSGEAPNDHGSVFMEYASSGEWTAVHLGQFAGMAVLVVGLLVLYYALDNRSGILALVARTGAVLAVVSLGLYGVLQAVDGVALKQAVDAWVGAPEADKTARFASAEAVRWLEWGVRSYHSFMLGLTFVLFAPLIVSVARLPRLAGYLIGLSGIAYLAQGWVIGSEGFSAANTAPSLLAMVLIVVWSLWLLVVAWWKAPMARAPAIPGRSARSNRDSAP
jgi:hypothetical protein